MSYLGPPPARTPVTSAQITDASVTAAKLATDSVTTVKIAANNVTTAKIAAANVTSAKVSSDVSQLGKNLVRNGAMTVAQRGTLTARGPNNEYITTDGWAVSVGGSIQARFTTSQDTSAPTGFGYSLKIDCTTAESTVAAGDRCDIRQRIEAQTLQQLAYGVAGAKAVTLSFNFRSPKTGTHCVALFQPDATRSQVKEFTIASANTWESFELTFSADASGTITNDTGAGLEVVFPLFAGTNFHIAADTWAASEDYATSNQQNLMDNTANNVQFSGVQLEVGSVATDFEHEAISVTLAKCVRYFERFQPSTTSGFICAGSTTASTTGEAFLPYVEKRGTPTVTLSADGTFSHLDGGGTGRAVSSAAVSLIDVKGCRIAYTIASGAAGGGALIRDSTDTTTIDITAEL